MSLEKADKTRTIPDSPEVLAQLKAYCLRELLTLKRRRTEILKLLAQVKRAQKAKPRT